ncbi:putative holin-like toxin [Fructobacillus tropaeoli]
MLATLIKGGCLWWNNCRRTFLERRSQMPVTDIIMILLAFGMFILKLISIVIELIEKISNKK